MDYGVGRVGVGVSIGCEGAGGVAEERDFLGVAAESLESICFSMEQEWRLKESLL